MHFFVFAFSLPVLPRIYWHTLWQLRFPLFLLASPLIPRPNTHTEIISWFRTIHGPSDLPWTICMTLGSLLFYWNSPLWTCTWIRFELERKVRGDHAPNWGCAGLAVAPAENTSNCSALRNVWQQFITGIYTEPCWPVWPGTYVLQRDVLCLRWCRSVSAQPQPCSNPSLLCFAWLTHLSTPFKPCKWLLSPNSSLFAGDKAHSFFPRKSHSKTLMSSLFSSLETPEEPCTGWLLSSYLFLGKDQSRAAGLDPLASIPTHLKEQHL